MSGAIYLVTRSFTSTPTEDFGLYKSHESPDFQVLLLAYGRDYEATDAILDFSEAWDSARIPERLIRDWLNPENQLVAWDAVSTALALQHVPVEPGCENLASQVLEKANWYDLATHALTLGLPDDLNECARVLNLPVPSQGFRERLAKFFTQPCRPTKRDPTRKRRLPVKHFKDWLDFRESCHAELITLRAIRQLLVHWPVPDFVWDEWRADRTLNARGLAIDQELVQGALDLANRERERLVREAREITGLENPDKRPDFTSWLEQESKLQGLRRKDVRKLLV